MTFFSGANNSKLLALVSHLDVLSFFPSFCLFSEFQFNARHFTLCVTPTNLLQTTKLQMTRKGIPPVLRCAVWLSNVVASVHPHQPPEYSQEYRTLAKVRALDMAYQGLLERVLSNKDDNPNDERSWKDMDTPIFGNDVEKYQENVPIHIKRVMIALDQVLGVIEYSPILPTLCELLLTHMSESYVFCALREMAHAPQFFFPT